MEDSKKICPVLTMSSTRYDECVEHKCAWWVSGYTTEKIPVRCCAMEFIAMKNEEGLYRV